MPEACPAPPTRSPAPPAATEPPDGLLALARAWRRRRPPADPAEAVALEELVACLWRRQQLAALEIALLERLARGEDAGPLPRLETIVRYAARLARGREAAEAELEALRRERPPRADEAAPADREPGAPPGPPAPAPAEPRRTAPASAAPRPAAPAPAARHGTPEPPAPAPRGAVPTAKHGAPEPPSDPHPMPAWSAALHPWPEPSGRAEPARAALLGSASAAALLVDAGPAEALSPEPSAAAQRA